MRDAATRELFATAHALEQVRAGVPFRDAYRAAARQVETLDAPDPADALAAYSVDGFPGRGRPDLVRDALDRHRAWLEPA
jgi:argininosuccinate lyase